MATQTTNYGLTKPSYNETADIGVINSNMDIIDAKMKAIENKAGSGGGSGNTDTYGHVKVGSVTIDASGDDTIELVAGSNVTLTPDITSKSVTISATGGGGGTSDYLQLSNKPKINGVELVDNITTEDLGIVVPQYTSELENDSGFITNETDPTVPAWAKEPTKPTYTAEEVGALPSNTPIPDPTSVVVDRFVSVGTHIADISVNGEKTELYAPTGGGGTSVTVDSELSTTSENPVQNKVITQALNEKSNLISDAWNASTTYAVGQYCIYNNSLWKCLVQHSGQTPTEGTYWTKVTVANEITSVNNSIGDISNVGNSTYNSVEKLLKYYIDNNYLPDVNDIALVPIMTSNNTPSGNCYFSCGEYSTDRGAYKAFDNNVNTHATSIGTNDFPVRLVYDFGANKKVRVKKASYTNTESGGHGYAVNGAEIQGSNDGTNWNTLGIFNIPASESNNMVINCSGDIPYRYICLMQPSKNNTNSGKGAMSLTELQFYGTEI